MPNTGEVRQELTNFVTRGRSFASDLSKHGVSATVETKMRKKASGWTKSYLKHTRRSGIVPGTGSSIEATQAANARNNTAVKFDLLAAKEKIGDYELDSTGPQIADDKKAKFERALYKGCPPEGEATTEARKEFMEEFNKLLDNIPAGQDREVTTLEDLFAGNKKLLKLYKKAVAEEANSRSFRDAVLAASTNERETSPTGERKMVMYVAGPSAAGKSHLRDTFVDRVEEQQNPDGVPQEGGPSYIVAVDGGEERQMCQMRQLVLQAATEKGYGGVSDLHKHTKTGVKSKILKAAMGGGNNVHVVIPATFISGLPKFSAMMRRLSKQKDTFQVFAEIRAEQNNPEVSKKEALGSMQQTIQYNGESRAYIQPGSTDKTTGEITMNNRDIGCESKEYQPQYFNLGVKFSRKAKAMFKLTRKSQNSLILSNESDNMHVDRNGAQTTTGPTVKHISRREVQLWKHLESIQGEDSGEARIAFKALGLDIDFETFLDQYQQDRGEHEEYGLADFKAFLDDNDYRARQKITVA